MIDTAFTGRCGFASRKGFTLMELLAVIAVLAVLAAILVPAVTVSRSFQLTQAVQQMADVFSLARQSAMAQNCIVEVRFYLTKNVEGATACRSYQLFQVSGSGMVSPLTRISYLGDGVIAGTGGSLSSLLDTSKRERHAGAFPVPGAGTDYQYFSFAFLPDGRTNLPAMEEWFVTLHLKSDGDGRTTPPPNFGTVQVDPVNGAVRTFRP
ncbi:hypothetical protein DB346_00765 [Verrucomicrobia bacterium LW23]|nr:hypothetical protein DB346_00765 [Verrucomicrobia bacterium LW23]